MISQEVTTKAGVKKTVIAETQKELDEAVKAAQAEDTPEKIDINKPVEQGHDMVINQPNGSQHLGTAEEATKAEDAGETVGAHTDKVQSDTKAPADEAKPVSEEAPAKSDAAEDDTSSDEKSEGDAAPAEGTKPAGKPAGK